MKNQKGILTIDFIFSFTMVIGLFQLFYAITYTFMVAHLTQYITFASARLFFAGHIDVQSQTALAERKYIELTQNSAAASFYVNAFGVSNFEAREFNEFGVPDPQRQKYVGVRIGFESKVLGFNVPFLGRTDSQLQGQGFRATMGSFLYREPTSSECFRFIEGRAQAILDLNGKYNEAVNHNFDINRVGVFSDNGC